MVAWLVHSGLRLGKIVVAAAAVALALGIPLVVGAPVEAYPEFMPTTVEVQTEALGLSATEVESLVTVPLEQDLLNGVPWLDRISSRSIPGLSAIDLVFKPGTEQSAARQLVQERMTQVRALPNVGTPPVMLQPLASAGRVSMVGLAPAPGTSLSLVDLSVLARWTIRPRLMGVPGVANVAVYGQRDRQLQVQTDPVRMAAKQVSLTEVTTTTANALWVSPLSFVQASTPGTGGFLESPNQRLAVQHILPISSAKDLAAVPVGGPHPGVTLGDVATVVTDHQPLVGDGVTSDASSLVLVIEKFPGASTEQVTQGVEQALDALRPGLRDVAVDTGIYRPASYLEAATHTIGLVGGLGLGLLALVVLVLSWSWRRAAVILGVLLLSLVTAAAVLVLLGNTLTSMTLLGLAAALAVLVDDVVGDVQAVSRRLEETPTSGPRRLAAATKGTLAARGALGLALVVVPLLTVPALFLAPFPAAFSRPLVVSYLVAVAVSALVVLLVTPTVCVTVLRRRPSRRSPVARFAAPAYRRVLERTLRLRAPTVAGFGVVALAGALLVPGIMALPELPILQDPNLLVHVRAMPGTSLTEMDRVTAALGKELRGVHGVVDVGTHVGRAVMSDQSVDVNSSEVWVSLDPDVSYPAARADVETVVRGYPGLASSVTTYPSDRLAVAQQASADVVVRVFGNDLTLLQSTARSVRQAVAAVPGVGTATVAPQPQQPAAQVVVDLRAAATYGLRPGDVRRQATTMMSGLLVGNLYEQQAVFDVVVQGPTTTNHSLTSLGDMPIDVPGGTQVPLRTVAAVHLAPEPTVIRHEGVSRATDVSVSVAGRSSGDVRADVEAAVRTVGMPPEFHAEVLLPTAATGGSDRVWQAVSLAAVLAVLLLLQAATGSWRVAGGLVLGLAVVAASGLAAATLAGATTSLAVLSGLLVGLAVAARQSVALVRQAQAAHGARDAVARVSRVAGRRLDATVLTCAGLAAALLPTLVLGDRPGLELAHPFAATALGSLVGAAATTLLLVPVLAVRAPARADLFAPHPSQPNPGHRRWPALSTLWRRT